MDRELLLEIGVEEMPASWLPRSDRAAGGTADRAPERRRPAVAHHGRNARHAAAADRLSAGARRSPGRSRRDGDGPAGVARHSTPRAIRRTPAWALRASWAWTSTPSSRRKRRRASTSPTSGTFAGRPPSTCCPASSARCSAISAFPKTMNWDAQLEDDRRRIAVRPSDSLAAVPLRRAGRAVHDRAAGAGVEPARAGRHDRRGDLRPPVPRDERPRRPRDQSARASTNTASASPRTSSSCRASIGAIASCATSMRTPASWAAARCCISTRRPRRCSMKCRTSSSFRRSSPACSRTSSSTLPPEVLTTTLIHHQHYFPVVSATGALMPAFLAVTNTQASNDRGDCDQRRARRDGAAARCAVLLGRRSQGRARSAAAEARRPAVPSGARVVPRRRPSASSGWRSGWRPTSSSSPLRRMRRGAAARLAKADLATDMVRELTELQGVMGGVYAREAGEPEPVWKAIYHHYLPVGVEPNAAPTADALGAGRVTWACRLARRQTGHARRPVPGGRAADGIARSARAAAAGARRAPDARGSRRR